jgi:membrane protein involved in colicin uptake
VQRAQAEAAQAGPLAEATAAQAVIGEQTSLAERNARLTEQRLESEVRRPADAEAYRQRTLAEAQRDAMKASTEGDAFKQRTMAEAARDTTKLNTEAETARRTLLATADAEAARAEAGGAADAARVKADGDAYAARTVADADAEAINARAGALSGEHQGLIAANKLVDMLPQLVQASAAGIEGSRLTILGGSAGVNDFATGLAAQGLSIYTALQTVLAATAREQDVNGNANGHRESDSTEARPAELTAK